MGPSEREPGDKPDVDAGSGGRAGCRMSRADGERATEVGVGAPWPRRLVSAHRGHGGWCPAHRGHGGWCRRTVATRATPSSLIRAADAQPSQLLPRPFAAVNSVSTARRNNLKGNSVQREKQLKGEPSQYSVRNNLKGNSVQCEKQLKGELSQDSVRNNLKGNSVQREKQLKRELSQYSVRNNLKGNSVQREKQLKGELSTA